MGKVAAKAQAEEFGDAFKQTEVAPFPKHWDVTTLGEISLFVTSGSRSWAAHYADRGALFVRSQNVRAGHLDFSDRQFVRPPAGSEGTRTRLAMGDLLITITGNSVGNVAWVDQDLGDAYISQHVGLVRLKDPSLADYVCRFLSPDSPGNAQIAGSQSGQSKPGLNLKNLEDFWLALPPSPEAQAIAVTLGEVDALLGALDRLIAKKRDLKQAAMQQLLTGQTRLPGFGSAWKATALGEVAEIVMGQSPSSVDYNSSGLGLPLIQGNADIEDRKTIARIFTSVAPKKGYRGDILLSVRAPVGQVAVATFDVCLGRGVCAIRPGSPFFYHALVSAEPSWARFSKGSTFDSVTSADVRAFQLFLPGDEKEQAAIAAVLSDMDADIAALEHRRDKTRLLKQGMMQELLTGRTRLV